MSEGRSVRRTQRTTVKGLCPTGPKVIEINHSGERIQGEHGGKRTNLSYAAQKTEPGPRSQIQLKMTSDFHRPEVAWTA